VADHERDGLRRRTLGGHDEVAFVLAILIVHDDDHAPGSQVLEDLLDGIQAGQGRALTGK
jgi:hypothetical protein